MGGMKLRANEGPPRPRAGKFLPRRWWRGAGRLGCLTLLVFVLVSGSALAGQVELDNDVYDIAKMIRCPVCQAESAADSNSEVSQSMREQIAEQLAAGKSEAEILDYFEERYGTWILMDPPKQGLHLLVWVLPLAGGIGGVAALTVFFRRWSRRAEQPVEASAEDLERVRKQLRDWKGEQ